MMDVEGGSGDALGDALKGSKLSDKDKANAAKQAKQKAMEDKINRQKNRNKGGSTLKMLDEGTCGDGCY
jgi:hypothetical protein